jgi:hypothetical protein
MIRSEADIRQHYELEKRLAAHPREPDPWREERKTLYAALHGVVESGGARRDEGELPSGRRSSRRSACDRRPSFREIGGGD